MTRPNDDGAVRSTGNGVILVVASVLGAAIVLVVALTTRFGVDPSDVASPLIGKPVPALTLDYLDSDGAVDLAASDDEILVLNFWASWCVPCRAEHRVLLDAAHAWEGADVRFVGILYQDRVPNAVSFMDEFGRGYEVVRDEGSRAAISFGVFGIPETFFVDRDGTIAAIVRGELDAETLASTLEAMLIGVEPASVDIGPLQPPP